MIFLRIFFVSIVAAGWSLDLALAKGFRGIPEEGIIAIDEVESSVQDACGECSKVHLKISSSNCQGYYSCHPESGHIIGDKTACGLQNIFDIDLGKCVPKDTVSCPCQSDDMESIENVYPTNDKSKDFEKNEGCDESGPNQIDFQVNHGGSIRHDNNLKMSAATYVDGTYVDGLCIDFCQRYFKKCATSNYYLNTPKKTNHGRNLIITDESIPPRASNFVEETNAIQDCQKTCMLWPRPQDPATYSGVDKKDDGSLIVNSNVVGDTFWCRNLHLNFIDGQNLSDAALHCPHASPPGGGICRDAYVDGYTPYELLRNGEKTRHHFGYCDLVGDGIIAYCIDNGIKDDTLPKALKMMPSSVKIIFLNGNRGITSLPANVFKDYLSNPSIVEAIYVDDCGIKTIHPEALNGLSELKIFNAGINPISELPSTMLVPTPKLLQFSVYFTKLSSIPETLFQSTPEIESISLFGHKDLTKLEPNTFRGLTKLWFVTFALCGFKWGFCGKDVECYDIFEDAISMKFFDMHVNDLQFFSPKWFNGGWGTNILRVAFFSNKNMRWEKGAAADTYEAFETLTSLEVVLLHDTKVDYLDPKLFVNKANFTHLTV